jgi:4-amino-4-deoxy-L-arabinose transferase-like glycosyltransferase
LPEQQIAAAQNKERERRWLVRAAAVVFSLTAFLLCRAEGWLLLYGDAVAHLHIARRITDSHYPGLHQLGSVWLPFSHLLLVPFVQRIEWWQSGFAGAIPSMLAYIAACIGIYRLARLWLTPTAALFTFIFFALNPGLLYLETTAMTEPAFLCEIIWGTLLLAEADRALLSGQTLLAGRKILTVGLILFAAVYTRYDGWIFASLCWLLPAAWMLRRKIPHPPTWVFVVFTLLLIAAPAGWLFYNARFFGDPLDFLRGPYSARAIELRTSPPGSNHYPGWHDMPLAFLYYRTAAALSCVPLWLSNVLFTITLAATALLVWRKRWRSTALVLLWFPLPFYAYSVAYGSVPIFMPQWRPNSYYNTRYGIELLPAFALAAAVAFEFLLRQLSKKRANWTKPVIAAAFLLLLVNNAALIWNRPLIFQEAVVNSSTRIPFETAIANDLSRLPANTRILMSLTDHVGAVQRAGLPLICTLNESDGNEFAAALTAPATHAAFVVALDGDAVAKAVALHPGQLTLVDTVCQHGQPCARIYRSDTAPTQEFSPVR